MGTLLNTHEDYDRSRFAWREVKDVLAGPHEVKRANTVYLPMPSGFQDIPAATVGGSTTEGGVANFDSRINQEIEDYQSQYLPWHHRNPAYQAYLHRARFPDITANVLRGLIGIATRRDPEIEMPSRLSYLIDSAMKDGRDIFQLYSNSLANVLSAGRTVFVLEPREDLTMYISSYGALDFLDWEEETIRGRRVLTRAVFREPDGPENEIRTLTYYIDDATGFAMFYREEDGTMVGVETELKHRGRMIKFLPIIVAGSKTNTAEVDEIPLFGLAELALAIYRKDADLAQAQFMTCNPTLFLYGVQPADIPATVGSNVVVGLPNPNSKAEYPPTDTSGLEHIRTHISDLFQEAIGYGANFLGASQRSRESGEALALRQSASGATLIHSVNQTGMAIEDILKMAAMWDGSDAESVEFEPSTEFAETKLASADKKVLLEMWAGRAISHDTLLDNLRDSGELDTEVTNEQEKGKIQLENPDSGMNEDQAAKLRQMTGSSAPEEMQALFDALGNMEGDLANNILNVLRSDSEDS